MANKSPLDKVLGKLEDLDEANLSNLVQRLARERKLLETVFDVIRDGILVLDESGIITYSNVQGRRLIGLNLDQVDKVPLLRAAPDLARSLGLDRIMDNTRPEVVVRDIQIKYPEKRFLRVYAVPMEGSVNGGKSLNDAGITVVLTDITEEKSNLEETIESEKINSIMDLAAGVAHELGNPLNSITIHLQVLQRTLSKSLKGSETFEKSMKSLDSCLREVQRLDSIIVHFLKAIRPSVPDFQSLDILEVIEGVLLIKEKELSAKKINVQLDAGKTATTIEGDPEQIKQAFFNVIGNSIDAITQKSDIRIILSEENDYLTVQIIDHGSGIEKENISKVFEPYFTTKNTGNGIGMMIVHRTMKNHGGEVGIDSKKGSGTIVTLKFPKKGSRCHFLEQR